MEEQVKSVVSVSSIANHDKSIHSPIEHFLGVESGFDRQGSFKSPYDHTAHLVLSQSNNFTAQANGLAQDHPQQSRTTPRKKHRVFHQLQQLSRHTEFQTWHQTLSDNAVCKCFSTSIPRTDSNADDFFQYDIESEFSYTTNSCTTSQYETLITCPTSTTEHDTMVSNTTNDGVSKSVMDFLEIGSWTLEQLSTYDTRYQWKDFQISLEASSASS